MEDNIQLSREEIKELSSKEFEELTNAEKTSKIKLSIKRRFDFPEWVIAFEVTGKDNRRADCIALNTLPSRNYKIVGFEFKSDRSDWLKEKRDGTKANHFIEICDEWYLVTAGNDIANEEELPEGWGLFELKPNSERLYKIKESNLTKFQGRKDPSREFYIRFMKKILGDKTNFTTQDLKEAQKRGYEEAVDDGIERNKERKLRRLERKAEKWDNLNESGIDFVYSMNENEIENLRLAYKLVEKMNGSNFKALPKQLELLRDDINRKAESMNEEIDELEEQLENVKDHLREDNS